MKQLALDAFHEASQGVDYGKVMEGLLSEFRQGRIAERGRVQEDRAIKAHLGGLSTAWDRVFPKFPVCPWMHRSVTWLYYRGVRDAYLKQLIVSHVPEDRTGTRLIVCPVTVFGRHARWLARALPDHEVVGTDIRAKWDRLYRLVSFWKYPGLRNYRFVRESIYEPDTSRGPVAVTFWGACGSLTDAAMDYAIAVGAPFLIFRSCCHDNIGHNTEIVRRLALLNILFTVKGLVLAGPRKKKTGFYFTDRYVEADYPRSSKAREFMETGTIIAAARNSVDSDICRSLIDLDRCMYLVENGYDVLYREELFFAHRR